MLPHRADEADVSLVGIFQNTNRAGIWHLDWHPQIVSIPRTAPILSP